MRNFRIIFIKSKQCCQKHLNTNIIKLLLGSLNLIKKLSASFPLTFHASQEIHYFFTSLGLELRAKLYFKGDRAVLLTI